MLHALASWSILPRLPRVRLQSPPPSSASLVRFVSLRVKRDATSTNHPLDQQVDGTKVILFTSQVQSGLSVKVSNPRVGSVLEQELQQV